MFGMVNWRDGVLGQIEAEVADSKVQLSSLLQRVVVLGGEAGSEKMRDWALQELHGYAHADTVPEYRRVAAALMAFVTNHAGYNGRPVQFHDSVFPDEVREFLRKKKVDLEEAVLGQGIGVIEAMADEGKDVHNIVPPWAPFIADTLNERNAVSNGRVGEVYLAVPNASVRGVLVRIHTALAQLVGELAALTPRGQEVPDRLAADQAVQFVVTGDRPVINYSAQRAGDGGTNVAVAGVTEAGPVTVSGANSMVVGSQSANGAGSSVVGVQAPGGAGSTVAGGQAVQAGRDADTVGSGAGDREPPVREGWWARLRKRGVIVALATIVGALAAVTGTAVALGWRP